MRALSETSVPYEKLSECVQLGMGPVYETQDVSSLLELSSDDIRKTRDIVSKHLIDFDIPKVYYGDVLVRRSFCRMLFQEMQKQQNVDAVVTYAYRTLEKEKEVSDIPVDKTWCFRFFNDAVYINDEIMQSVWGNILAGEIKRPGTFPLNALDKLKNVGELEVDRFKRLSSFIMTADSVQFILDDQALLTSFNINLEEWIPKIVLCGLIAPHPVSHTIHVKKNVDGIIYNSKVVGVIAHSAPPGSSAEKTLDLSIYPLTETGTLLAQMLHSPVNEKYPIEVMKHLRKRNKKFKITAHVFDFIDEEGIINYVPFDVLPMEI